MIKVNLLDDGKGFINQVTLTATNRSDRHKLFILARTLRGPWEELKGGVGDKILVPVTPTVTGTSSLPYLDLKVLPNSSFEN
jgi:hypothetical protein